MTNAEFSEVCKRRDKCIDYLKLQGYNVIFVGLYGSQNYNMQTENSDYDFKAIVVPTLDDIIRNKQPTSKTIDCHDIFNGQVDVKDIRWMVNEWKKGAVNFMEILFTACIYINSNFSEMNWFIKHREEIAHANNESTLKAMIGMITNKLNNLYKQLPCQIAEIEQYGYSGKQLCHALRLNNMIKYYHDLTYAELLNPEVISSTNSNFNLQDKRCKQFEIYRDIKTHKLSFSNDDIKELTDMIIVESDECYNAYKQNGFTVNTEIFNQMDEMAYSIIRKVIKDEILKEDN